MKKPIILIIMLLAVACTGLMFGNLAAAQSSRIQKTGSETSRVPKQLVPPPTPQYQPRPWEPIDNVPEMNAPVEPSVKFVAGVWTSIGPGPLSSGGSTGNVSGRITGIAAHPTDPLTIYIAAAGGGVWKTINGGSTWLPLTDAEATLSMGCIAIAPSNPLVLYAGTGEANNSGDSNFGRGILVTIDGGVTWTRRTGPSAVFNTNRMTCSKIAVDPTNANVAYAAMANLGMNGIFAGGITGIFKTSDGGATWTNVTAADGKDSSDAWSDVAVDPNTPSIVYGAVGAYFGAAGNAVYKSSNSGSTWTLLNAANAPAGSAFGRISLAVSKAVNANVLYDDASNPATSGLSRLVRSDDAGTSFNIVSPSNYMGAEGWYDQSLIVDPTNSAIVYATGAAGGNSILRSINSGGVWTDIHTGVISPHVDHHATAFDANGKLLEGDDGGIYRLDDPTVPTWSNLNGNLSTIQFQGIGLHPTNANIAVGGSQDNGTEIYSGSATWTATDGGDGGPARFSPTNGGRVYHQIPVGSAGNGNFFRRSDNTGTSWLTKTTGMSSDNTQNFYAPYSVSPVDGDRVLYGATHVWETTNGGDLWTAIATSAIGGFNSGGANVDAIGIAPSDVNTLYASTGGTFASSSKIFVTTTRGTSWTEHDLPAGNGRVNELQVDPANAQTAYAVINTFSANGNVFKTTDGGTNWTNISGDLATVTACTCVVPIWSLQIDNTAGKLYIGAEDGVYVTSNGGTNWTRFGTGLPNGQVVQIELNKTLNILGAAIHGRGMWEISVATTAAGVSVSGRVVTADGRGLRNAQVVLIDSKGIARTVVTGVFGNYQFDDVQTGDNYMIGVVSKRYRFESRVLPVFDTLGDVDFVALN